MKTQPKNLVAVVMVVLSLAAGHAHAISIGANFVNDNNGGEQDADVDSLSAGELAGAPGYAQTNWNNLGRWGNPTTLNDSTGNASGVDITWDADWTVNLGGTPATPDQKLMYGFDQATGVANDDGPPFNGYSSPNQPDSRVRGLTAWLASRGASTYSVILYVDGDRTDGSVSEWWLQGIATDGSFGGGITLGGDLTPHIFMSDSNNFSGTYIQVPPSATSMGAAAAGNYILFTGLSADMFVQRCEDTYATYAPRSAIQIVPEYTIPHIDAQPAQLPAGALYKGQSFSLSVVAAGSSLQYQWRKNSTNLVGQTTASFSASNITTNDSGTYDVVITNSFGSVTSAPVMITVNGQSPPQNAAVSPASVTRGVGGVVTLTLTVNGSTPFSYQWIKDATPLTGQTNATLVLTNLALVDSGSYICAVTNFLGGMVSTAGTLTVNPVAGTTLGINFTDHGEVVTATAFAVPVANWTDLAGANGFQSVGSLAVTWASANTWHTSASTPGEGEVFAGYLDDGNGGPSVTISGLNGAFGACVVRTLGATDNGSGLHFVTLTNDSQSLTYAAPTASGSQLTGISSVSTPLYDDGLKLKGYTGDSGGVRGGLAGIIITDKPVIDQQPHGPTNTVYVGGAFSLAGADAFGVPGLGYQWRKNGSDISGATYLNYTNPAPTTGDSGNYTLVVTNAFGSATSSVVAVTISSSAPINVAINPASAAYSVGGTVVFTVAADGNLPLTFQWYKGASLLSGKNAPALTLSNLQPGDAGSYTCAVTNSLGGVLSPAVVLTISAVPPASMGINFAESGEPVSVTAFGVDPTNWTDLAIPTAPFTSSVTIGPVNVMCAASDPWQQQIDPTTGDTNAVFYAYLDDGAPGGYVTFTGLAGVFPVYVVQALGATDNGSSLLPVTVNGSQMVSYLSPVADTNIDILDPSPLVGLSTQSTALYADTLTLQAQPGLSGQGRGGLAGVIITDKPVYEGGPQTPTSTIYTGGSFSLTGLTVIGVPPLSYQWRKNGVEISAANSAVYTKPNASAADNGNYDVVVTNAYGSVLSAAVPVTVSTATVPNVTATYSGSHLILNWPAGTLLEATNVTGPWTTNSAASPYTNAPTAPQQFYRLLLP